MKKRVAICAALGVLVMQGGSAYAGVDGDYPISGGGGDPQCEETSGSGGGDGGTTSVPAGEGTDGCWQPPADPGDPAPGNPVPGISSRAPAAPQQLPETGSDNGDALRIGGASVLAGLGLVVVARRRRQTVVA